MAADILTTEKAQSLNFNLVTDPDKGRHALHETVVALRALRRAGTASTKNRSEVRGSNKKLWRQKGTGRARMGSVRSPIWRGGGVVFGPRPRDYSKKVNNKVYSLAFRKALSERIAAGDVLTIDAFTIADGKTKSFAAEFGKLVSPDLRVLLVGDFDEATIRASRNLPNVLILSAFELDPEEVLFFDKILITQEAVSTLAQLTA